MANPFQAKFNSTCNDCSGTVEPGDNMFADDGDFICEDCATDRNIICECGNYKKEEYDTCFDCK
jgi:hypothetical protein